MSNRVLGILILLGFLFFGYFYYIFSFIPKQQEKKILLNKYNIEKNKNLELKKVRLIKINKGDIKISNDEKIKNIIENEKYYKYFNLDNGKKVYFIKKGSSLEMFYDNIKIGIFDLVSLGDLRVDIVLGSNDLYFEIGNEKYYYNEKLKSFYNFNLNYKVNYVKKGNNNIIIITEKGSIIYDFYYNKLEVFSYFNDFIYYGDGYIGLIKVNDLGIRKNLGIKGKNNIIMYYNPKTKDKVELLLSKMTFDNIYIKGSNIYLRSDNNDYKIENVNKNIK